MSAIRSDCGKWPRCWNPTVTRLQYSVFRCRLDMEMLERLHWQLAQIMEDVDDLLVIPLVQPMCRPGAGALHGRPIELGRAVAHVQNRLKGQSWIRRVVEKNRGAIVVLTCWRPSDNSSLPTVRQMLDDCADLCASRSP